MEAEQIHAAPDQWAGLGPAVEGGIQQPPLLEPTEQVRLTRHCLALLPLSASLGPGNRARHCPSNTAVILFSASACIPTEKIAFPLCRIWKWLTGVVSRRQLQRLACMLISELHLVPCDYSATGCSNSLLLWSGIEHVYMQVLMLTALCYTACTGLHLKPTATGLDTVPTRPQ